MSQALRFRRLAHGAGLPLPHYASEGAAGFDLSAAVDEDTPIHLAPGERALVPTGFACAIPQGFEGQVRPRSGLAVKHGLTVLNAPGTVDWDYRGEIMVPLINLGTEPFGVTRGLRVAQMVIAAVTAVAIHEVETLDETERGTGGFGSTGV